MSYIDSKGLKNLIRMAEKSQSLDKTVKSFTQKYTFRVKLQPLTREQFLHIVDRINHRYRNKKHPKAHSDRFGNSELKIFCWVVIYYCHVENKTLPELGQQDFEALKNIFKKVDSDRIAYEVTSFYATKNARNWQPGETQLFKVLVKQKHGSEWKSIAYEMYKRSQRSYFRFFEECREKWINHLNPNLNKGAWTKEDEIELMRIIIKLGHKWALISRNFRGCRNQHAIKNEYKKLTKKFLGASYSKTLENKELDIQILNKLKEEYEIINREEHRGVVKEEEGSGKTDFMQVEVKEESQSNGYIFYPVKPLTCNYSDPESDQSNSYSPLSECGNEFALKKQEVIKKEEEFSYKRY